MFCSSFANRASVFGDLYIDFTRNHLIFPAAYLVCQVDAWSFFFFRSTHMHRISHLAYHACIASCCLCIAPWLIVGPLLVFLLWVEPGDEYANEEPIEYALEDQALDNSENFAGKMTIPSKSLLSLLASCSFYRYVALPTTCLSCLTYFHVKPLTHLPSKPLFGYVTAFLSPPYSDVSCRWRLEFVPCRNMFIVAISVYISCLL